jgi:ABC-type transport system involved in cytochrome c biogenesis permease subunit
MQEVRKIQSESSWKIYLPAGLAIGGAFAMLFLRIQTGARFIADESLMMLALAAYILAALFQLTNLYAPSRMAEKIGLWGGTLGVFFNLSSWLVRWVAAYDHEIAQLRAAGSMETPWMFRYIPFANLYDLSLAFAFGAGITTLLLVTRKNFQFLSAFTLPLAAIILTLARFIGGEHSNLMPILDSYWRPIHVGVAALSYGIALVCFAVAVIYLLKDKVRVEAMAIWAGVFALGVFATVSKFSVFTEFVYRAGIFLPNKPKPLSLCRRISGRGRLARSRHDRLFSDLSLSKQRGGEKDRSRFAEAFARGADSGHRLFGFRRQIHDGRGRGFAKPNRRQSARLYHRRPRARRTAVAFRAGIRADYARAV